MNKIRAGVLLVLLGLAGCASPYDPTPDIYDVTSQKQVDDDKAFCLFAASKYQRPFSTEGVAVAGGTGFGSNLGLAAQGMAGPILGGVGGILTAFLERLGLLDTDTPKAYQECLRQKFDRDHAAILVEPRL